MSKSVIIRKSRNKWYLATNELYDGLEVNIHWDNTIPPSVGTKHQRAYLLKSVKGLIVAMAAAPRDQKGDMLAHGSVLNWWYTIRRLVRWMIKRDCWRFSALSSADISAYLAYCELRDDGAGKVASHTLNRRVAILNEMWSLRKQYSGSFRVNPSVFSLNIPPSGSGRSSWRALDEPVALPLIGDAIRWLRTHADYLLTVIDRRWQSDLQVGRTKDQRKKARGKLYVEIENEAGLLRLREDISTQTKPAHWVVRKALAMTEGACVVLMLFLIGMRIRELARLDSGCLVIEQDSIGNEMARLQGIAAKQGGRSRTWISCDPVNEAVSYLERCYAAGRMSSRQKSLFVRGRNGEILSPGFRTYRVQPSSLRARMVTFARSPYRSNSPPVPRLHPHVARKTFARFVVLRDKRALESLSYHFGHVHRSVTDGAYIGSDIELAKLVQEEGRKDLAKGLTDLLKAEYVGGKAGGMLSKMKHELKGKFKGKKSYQSLVEKLIRDGVQLAPCDWGYCVYSQSLSACLGDMTGPNDSRRSPDICSGCSNFAVTESHRAWWEDRYEQDDGFLKQQNLPAQTIRWVEQRRENTGLILKGLNKNLKLAQRDEEKQNNVDC